MKTKSILVLSTSDIMRFFPSDETEKPTYQCGDVSVYSTGVLEKAIEGGQEVYLTTTRKKLLDHDAWWQALIPSDHIFPLGQYCGGGSADQSYINHWKGIYKFFGLTPDPTWDQWTQYARGLRQIPGFNSLCC